MMNLRKVFKNWFKTKQISFSELCNYAGHQLTALTMTNPGGLIVDRIVATKAALDAVEASVTGVGIKLGAQKAQTKTKQQFRKSLPGKLARIHGALVGEFGPGASEVTGCFPQGRYVFRRCRDEELDNILEQLVGCLTPYAAQVGQAHVDTAQGLLDTWKALYSSAGGSKTGRASQLYSAREVKAQLQRELYLNVLALALTFPEQPMKCDLYCPQELLHNRKRRKPKFQQN